MLTVPRPLRDAWRTLVPSGTARTAAALVLVALTVATGVVDAFSYLVLGHVFVANMTGNVIFIAVSLAGAPEFSLPASVVSLLAFVVGAVGAARLGRRVGAHRGRQVLVLCAVETVLLATAFGCAELVANPFTGGWGYLLIVLTALAWAGRAGWFAGLGCQT